MKANRKIVLAIAAALCLAIIAAVVIYVVRKERAENQMTLDSVTGDITDGNGNLISSGSDVLSYGSRGANVKRLQEYLNGQLAAMYYLRGEKPQYNGTTIDQLVVDGIFGPKTLCVTRWCFNKDSVSLSEIGG